MLNTDILAYPCLYKLNNSRWILLKSGGQITTIVTRELSYKILKQRLHYHK